MGNVHRLGNVISDLAGGGNVMGPFFPTCEEFKFLKNSIGFLNIFTVPMECVNYSLK